MTPSSKKKKVSKKSKTSWRKHVNIQDVEDYLDDVRLEERLGGISEKKDEELFVIDTQPEKGGFTTKESRKQKKRLELASKQPRCYDILNPHTKVPDPVGRRNHVKPVGSLPADLSNLSHARKTRKGIYKKRMEVATKNRQSARAARFEKRKALSDFERDVWNVQDENANGDLSSDWVSTGAKLASMEVTGQKRRGPSRAPSTNLSKSKIPAVVPPHPGASYNPSYQDHQSLLQEVAKKEVEVMKKEQHLKRVTTKMFKKVNPKQRDQEWLVEMSAGIPTIDKQEQKSQQNEEESDSDYKALNPPVRNKKKTTSQRNKQKEHRAEQDKLRRAKQEKKKEVQIYRLRKIETEIDKTEDKIKKAKVHRDKKITEYEATGMKKLNAHKFEEPGEDFVLATELTGNLRSLKAETNLLKERYISMQRRNILPPSRIYARKKTKAKRYIKRSHRIPEDKLKAAVKAKK